MSMNQHKVNTPLDVDAVFTALEKWINQRPGLDFRNYGAVAPYRAELRSIANDKKRALKALDEARGLQPARPELLLDAFRAFSGRLELVPLAGYPPTDRTGYGLAYTTGQYWPTEYRKAAAAVLESYISAWRQAENAAAPQAFTYHTMADVKAANQAIGNHWFDRDTMRFFNTRIESGLIGGRYFITSERRDENHARRYTVRRADPDGTIDTVGEFHSHLTIEDARESIREAMKGDK